MPLARFRTGRVQRWRWRALVLMSVALSAILTTALWAAHLHAPPTRAAGSLSFAPHTDYFVFGGGDVLKSLTSVAISDFNGDGKADLAATEEAYAGVSVLLGSGGGAFGQAVPYSIPGPTVSVGPTSVAVSDLNGDMNLDLAVAGASGTAVSVLDGNGSGSFFLAPDDLLPFAGHPRSLVAGDVTGDGTPDFVTANPIAILPNVGGGAFGMPEIYGVGFTTTSVAIGDVNTDGRPDLAAAGGDAAGGAVGVLLNTVNNGFQHAALVFPVGMDPQSIAAGDLNGDSLSDLVTANRGSGDVSVLLGDGQGGFSGATNVPVGAGPRSVASGDLNGDGKLDLVTADGASNDVRVLLGTGSGGFAAAVSFAVGLNPGSVAVGDLNGDGKPDVVTANAASSNVSVLLNTTTSGAPTPTPGGGSSDTNVTLTLTGGELSATTLTAPSLTAALTGQDQTLTYALPISVTDATASGNGWNLTLTSTPFTSTGAPSYTLPADASRVSGVTAVCANGVACVAPVNGVSYPLAVPAGVNAPAVKLFNAAANSGLGAFTITPTVSVFIPAGAHAGSYTSTFTLAIVSGP